VTRWPQQQTTTGVGTPRTRSAFVAGTPRAPGFAGTPRAPGRSRARSFAAWVSLVLLIGVGHVVPALHFLFVAHHLCAEHGELVDATGESAEPARDKASHQSAFYEAGEAAHSHAHCGVLAQAHASGAPASAPGFVQILPPASVASVAGQARDAHVDIALLDYAPKLAPPQGALLAALHPQS